MPNSKEISSRGIAQRSGLDVFSSIIIYNGEYLNWGDAAVYGKNTLDVATDYATTAADPHTDALTNSPASDIGRWYRYHTSGAPYTSISAPTSTGSVYYFYGQESGGLPSYSGMYQKLSLIRGNEYQIEVQSSISPAAGTLYIRTYMPFGVGFIETSSSNITFPVSETSTSIHTSTFTAETANDIIVFYFTTESTSSVYVGISNFSIKEKQEYLVPVYATDEFGNGHKVLRRNAGNIVSND